MKRLMGVSSRRQFAAPRDQSIATGKYCEFLLISAELKVTTVFGEDILGEDNTRCAIQVRVKQCNIPPPSLPDTSTLLVFSASDGWLRPDLTLPLGCVLGAARLTDYHVVLVGRDDPGLGAFYAKSLLVDMASLTVVHTLHLPGIPSGQRLAAGPMVAQWGERRSRADESCKCPEWNVLCRSSPRQ